MKYLVILVLSLLVAACGDGSNSRGHKPATLRDQLQGNWKRLGYGQVIQIEGLTLSRYDFTTQTCVRTEAESVDDFEQVQLAEDGTEIVLGESPLTFGERYAKVDSKPAPCAEPIAGSPVEIYSHVWQKFNEYYAFFNERQVDWLAQFDATRDAIFSEMSDAELFSVLSQLVSPLDDEHVLLQASDQYSFSPATPKGFLAQLIGEFDEQAHVSNLNNFISLELAKWDENIRENYLEGDVKTAGDGTFMWGTIADEIAYLRIDAMIFDQESEIVEQVAKLEKILDRVFSDIDDTAAMIVDIRLNPGGADPLSFAIARRFADAERVSVRKYTRSIEGDGRLQTMILGPVDRPSYHQPVVLITSGFSTSAAEVFTLAMRAWPQVTHLGEPTNGSLSDVLSKPLPNGWAFELANEVYLDAEGFSFEATGVPPGIVVPIFAKGARAMGQDSGLDAALEHLGVDVQGVL